MTTYRIPELSHHYAKHDMIQAHTELPPLADPRARMLFAFLNQQGKAPDKSELYTLVVALVQLGLDTHDLLDTETAQRTEREMRSRQLKVLAGDFFSARFYQLLAAAGQIEMITRISNAVCEVNRLKVNLYVRMRSQRLAADDYFNGAVQLKGELFHHFSEMLEGAASRLWPELLQGVSRCEVAMEELDRCDDWNRFEKGWAYWHLLQAGTEEERQRILSTPADGGFIRTLIHKYDIKSQLAAKAKQAADSVIGAAGKLESDLLIRELSSIVGNLTGKLAGNIPALNETR
ncbi:heptaprenyl diphosphate synthase component 1 [Paenibacillus sp. GCM10027627]|uniref:heptaprenyl diphosphate synthase component 1 n=1 Tax=unclassified Paenibacillus TaxID=185978 RepID=UPI00362C236A